MADQLHADIFKNKEIPGLKIRIPALRAKVGPYTCYTFSIKPEYLLKIGFISHRTKGKASDVNTYQRLMAKSRLRRIQRFIEDGGIFPTNIVINLEKTRALRFDKAKQEGASEGSANGYLTISARYKSAWIIDGQHRLYGYSGTKKATESYLNVIAFEGLPASQQAQFFIDINSQQKKVSRNLLLELYGDLNWDASDPKVQIENLENSKNT